MIGIADCNNFYVSCERIFHPQLEGKPVLVVGNNDGCVIARSNEVKALNIPMGAPLHTIRHLVKQHGIQVFSANFALYGDISQRVMQELAAYAPAMQVYSIDEAFLDLAHVPHDEQERAAAHLRATVRRNTGVPISIGIAATKTLSKLANDRAKKLAGGILFLHDQDAVDDLLRRSDVEDIWGIAGRRATALRNLGIHTAYDLAQADIGIIKRKLSVVVARTALELRGVAALPLEAMREPRKEICVSRAFSHHVQEIAALREAVATYVTRAAEKLRTQHSVAGIVTVFLHTNPFAEDLPQYAAHCAVAVAPTNTTRDLIAAALRGIDACYKSGYAYHKAGVVLTNLTADHLIQATLFAPETDPRRQQLQVVIDDINTRWGRDTIRYAASGVKRPWAMKQGNRSARYTTRWDELPEAH